MAVAISHISRKAFCLSWKGFGYTARVIDDQFEVLTLLSGIREQLPLKAYPTTALLRGNSRIKGLQKTEQVEIVDVLDGGDEAGILCVIASNRLDDKKVHCVSLTHLRVPPTSSLTKDLAKYCMKRIKKLKRRK